MMTFLSNEHLQKVYIFRLLTHPPILVNVVFERSLTLDRVLIVYASSYLRDILMIFKIAYILLRMLNTIVNMQKKIEISMRDIPLVIPEKNQEGNHTTFHHFKLKLVVCSGISYYFQLLKLVIVEFPTFFSF